MDKIPMAIEILRQMSNGMILPLENGHRLGMAGNGFVGYIINDEISMFSEVTFSELVDFCKDIIVIPK